MEHSKQSKNNNNKNNMSAIIAVSPDAYERMMAKLNAGEEFVKTYRSYCPHAKNPEKCECPFYKNILVNGEIMREVDGELIKIHKVSKQLLAEVMRRNGM